MSSYPKHELPQNTLLKPTSLYDNISVGISESPSLKEITAGTNDLHKNSSIKDEVIFLIVLSSKVEPALVANCLFVHAQNVLSRANCKDANTKTLGSPSSSTMQPTQKQHLDTNKNSSVPKGSNFASFSDEPAISHKVVSKRTSSKYDVSLHFLFHGF